MKLRLLPEAERDLELGADFYDFQREGLGIYFNDCIDIYAVLDCRQALATIDRILNSPRTNRSPEGGF